MFTIYLITNKVNGKVYVGQTERTAHERWLEHLSYSRRDKDQPLYRAMRKYGKDNFECFPILEVEGPDQAFYQERVWIILLRAHVSQHGYVCTWGGDGRIGPCPETRWKRKNTLRVTLAKDPTRHSRYRADIDDKEIVRLFVDEQWTRKQIAEKFSCSLQLVKDRTRKLGVSVGMGRHKKGFKHSEEAKHKPRIRLVGSDNHMFRNDLKDSVLAELYDSGLSLRQIGSRLSCSSVCVGKRLKKFGVTLRPAARTARNKE